MKKKLPSIFLILFMLAGVSLLLYPTVSNWWNSLHQSVALSDYSKATANLSKEQYDEILENAYKYNEKLYKTGGNRFVISDAERAAYNKQLNIEKTGVMGSINIPAIRVTLPIYHGTNEAVLSSGVGHLEGTALPVGGKNTHCVLSGHRGLPSAKLFTHLDKLKEGDTFTITVLAETLTYEVDQIRIVLPYEIGDLSTVSGKDYCTLVTCTPYGINSHRMLVRGHRIETETEKQNVRVTSDALLIDSKVIAPIVAAPILLVIFIVFMIKTRKRMPAKKSEQKKGDKNKKQKK